MNDPMDKAALEASQSLDWRRVTEQLLPRYTQASTLAGQAAMAVANQAKMDGAGARLLEHEQWFALVGEAFARAFEHALEDLDEELPAG